MQVHDGRIQLVIRRNVDDFLSELHRSAESRQLTFVGGQGKCHISTVPLQQGLIHVSTVSMQQGLIHVSTVSLQQGLIHVSTVSLQQVLIRVSTVSLQ